MSSCEECIHSYSRGSFGYSTGCSLGMGAGFGVCEYFQLDPAVSARMTAQAIEEERKRAERAARSEQRTKEVASGLGSLVVMGMASSVSHLFKGIGQVISGFTSKRS